MEEFEDGAVTVKRREVQGCFPGGARLVHRFRVSADEVLHQSQVPPFRSVVKSGPPLPILTAMVGTQIAQVGDNLDVTAKSGMVQHGSAGFVAILVDRTAMWA